MSAGDTVHYPFPEELARIPRDRSAVIAASAGTGKTYLIEHLVVDRLVRGEARLDEMLVVTFTERAAAELRRRIQSLIDRVRTAGETTPPSGPSWLIDAGARARLVEAARGIDGASIATIHAFCQRVLTEQAFASGRLLVQQSVESRAAFAAAFAEVLRHRLAVDEDLAPYLEGYLAAGHSVEDLEQLLYQARQLRASWRVDFDPERLARAGSAFASLPPAQIDAEVARGAPNRTKGKAVEARLRLLHRAALQFDGDRDTARFLAAIDFLVKEKDLFVFVGERLGPAAAALAELVAELGEVAVPLDTVVAQRLGPPVGWPNARRRPGSTTSTTCWSWSTSRCGARAAPSWSPRCAAASSWPSSTSSKTPIRCSGGSSVPSSRRTRLRARALPSVATPAGRSIWSAIPSSRSTVSVAPTWPPSRRPAARWPRPPRPTTCRETSVPPRP
jgi:exodeoxyribonuclease V beta subunit